MTETDRIKYGIPSLDNENLYLDQPPIDLEFEAEYEIDKCSLTVIDGVISKDGKTSDIFDVGDKIDIEANTPNGYVFSHWEVVESNPIWPKDGQGEKATHIIIREDTVVRAIFDRYHIPDTSTK